MNEPQLLKRFDILLVDDNAADAMLFYEALKEIYPATSAYWASSGEEALEFLRREGRFSNMGPVRLIVLDLNMPVLNGFETLKAIKQDALLSLIPVVLLSSSRAKEDIQAAYTAGASVFFPKALSWEQYTEEVRVLVQHWLQFAELPRPVLSAAAGQKGDPTL
jgi:CheY-like chemotaxis protein